MVVIVCAIMCIYVIIVVGGIVVPLIVCVAATPRALVGRRCTTSSPADVTTGSMVVAAVGIPSLY